MSFSGSLLGSGLSIQPGFVNALCHNNSRDSMIVINEHKLKRNQGPFKEDKKINKTTFSSVIYLKSFMIRHFL